MAVDARGIHDLDPVEAGDLAVSDNVRVPLSVYNTATGNWESKRANLDDIGGSGAAVADTVTPSGTLAVKSSGVHSAIAAAVDPFTGAWVRSFQPGAILLIRGNAVVYDGADTRVTAADYGNGFKAALAAAQPGDVLVCGPGEFELADALVTQKTDLTILCNQTRLRTNANYGYVLQFDRCHRTTLSGLTCDGNEDANAPPSGNNAWGIVVKTSDDFTLIDSGALGINAALDGYGSGLFVWESFRFRCYGYRSERCRYAGFILTDAIDAKMFDTTVINPRDRVASVRTAKAVGVSRENGESAMRPWRTLLIDGIDGYIDELPVGKTAFVGINFDLFRNNLGQRLEELHMRRGHFKGEDIYNDALANNGVKFQGIDRVYMDDVYYDHYANAGAGELRSIVIESTSPDFPPIKELHMRKVRCSGHLVGNNTQIDALTMDECEFGLRHLEGSIAIRSVEATRLYAKRSRFNLHDGSRAFDTPDPFPADYRWRIEDCEIIANDASPVFAVLGNYIANAAGQIVFHGNRLVNNGAGLISLSNTRQGNFILSTDRNGDLLWDADIAASSGSYNVHPEPGAGPNYFTDIGASIPGIKIWNVKKATTGSAFPTCWISDGTNWKSLIA